jgi:hypothetical protein
VVDDTGSVTVVADQGAQRIYVASLVVTGGALLLCVGLAIRGRIR